MSYKDENLMMILSVGQKKKKGTKKRTGMVMWVILKHSMSIPPMIRTIANPLKSTGGSK